MLLSKKEEVGCKIADDDETDNLDWAASFQATA